MVKRRVCAIALIFVLVTLYFSGSAIATGVDAKPPTGDTVFYCDLTFIVNDDTGGKLTDDFYVILTDIATGVQSHYDIPNINYLFGISVAGRVIANTTYTIAFDFNGIKGYDVVNEDGSPIKNFGATASGQTFNWKLVAVDGTNNNGQGSDSGAMTSNTQNNTGSPGAGRGGTEVQNTDADSVYSDFLSVIEGIDQNKQFAPLFQHYKNIEATCADRYAKYCGFNRDDWFNFTPMEQFLWYELYVNIVTFTQLGTYDSDFSTIEQFRSNVASSAYSILNNICKAPEQAAAFRAITDWQYEYFMEHGEIYNFFTGKTDVQENPQITPVVPSAEVVKEATQAEKQDEQALKDVQREVRQEAQPSVTVKPGIWDSTVAGIKSSWIAILVLIVLVGGVAVIIIIRKRKAIDSEDTMYK